MSPLPVIADTFRCALEWTAAGGQHAVNVIHVHHSTGAGDAEDAFSSIDAHVTNAMFGIQSDSWAVDFVKITPLDGITPTVDFSTGRPAKWTGGGGTEWMPAVANIVKLKTAKRGRSYRGRIFLPAVAENQATDGAIGVSDAEAVEDAWETFQAGLATNDYHLVVASYKHATQDLVTVFTAETMLATQKRRQDRLR